jgi:hypothetical protein
MSDCSYTVLIYSISSHVGSSSAEGIHSSMSVCHCASVPGSKRTISVQQVCARMKIGYTVVI